MTLAQALDDQQLNRFRRRVTALSSAGMFLDGFDLTVIAVALPLLTKQWHLGGTALGLTSSSALLGMFVGALALGWLTDKIGRKRVYSIDLIFFVIFALAAAASQNVTQLVIFRFLLGVAIGADYPISTSLTAEFAAARGRGRHLAYMSSFYSAGAVVAYLTGIAFAGLGPDSWRWMLLVGAVLAAIVTVLRRAIPESPRWLAAQGRGDEAGRIIDGLVGRQPDRPAARPVPTRAQLRASLTSPRYLRATVFVCLFYFLFDIVFYGIQLYAPTAVAGLTGSSSGLAALGSAGISAIGLVGMLVGSTLIERLGRKPLVILGLSAQAVLLALLAVIGHPPFALVILLFAGGLFFSNIGPGIMILLYPSELFPTELRGVGVGLSVAASRVGAVLGVFLFPNLIDAWGLQNALWLFVAVGVLAIVLSVFMAPETKGRTIEETSGSDDPGIRSAPPASVAAQRETASGEPIQHEDTSPAEGSS